MLSKRFNDASTMQDQNNTLHVAWRYFKIIQIRRQIDGPVLCGFVLYNGKKMFACHN